LIYNAIISFKKSRCIKILLHHQIHPGHPSFLVLVEEALAGLDSDVLTGVSSSLAVDAKRPCRTEK